MRIMLASSTVHRCARYAAILMLALACSAPAFAQTLYGSLVGTVTDESGLAVPGATVTITHTETNQTRVATTGTNGAYTFTNIATGTYQIDVTLPGFQSFRARNVVVQQNSSVRMDAKLAVGALSETVLVSGSAAILQTESAAVQSVTTSQQLESLPTSGRSYQSLMNLMPGVAQPYMMQAGGINNPARSMGVSVNGQPPQNTVFRIDGTMVTNQWYPDLQSYSPGLEAVETVSVVTNSFDADQGMAGGAAVNVQVKSGTNTVAGSTFEYMTDSRLKNRPYFLPKGAPKGADQKHVSGGTIGGPIVKGKLFYFVSVETEFRRVKKGTVQLAEGEVSTGTTGLNTLPPADLRAGDFSRTGTVIYDPATGTATGTGRVPFAFANCPGVTTTTDPRFASCNYIPANRINSISKGLLDKLILPTTNAFQDNYYARDTFESDLAKLDTKTTWAMGNRLTVNNRVSWLGSKQNSHGIFPSLDGSKYNPLSVGRLWKANITSGSLLATAIMSQSFVVDGTFGYTPYHSWVEPEGPKQCWGDSFGIPNACQPPYSRDRATPMFTMGGWSVVTPSQMRDYGDNQIQTTANAGWTKGTHNVKFGYDINKMYANHYETAVPVFTFNGGETALNGGVSPNNFNQFADFLLGLPFSRSAQAMTPLLSEDGAKSPTLPATVRSSAYGLYLRDQWQMNRKMTASVGMRWEYYPFARRADSGLEIFDFTTNRIQMCGLPGSNADVCNIKTQKDLFTPRLGLAYRPSESTVIRVGFSRNPQNDNAVSRVNGIAQAFPKLITITQSGANTFAPVGNLSAGVPLVPLLDRSAGTVSVPSGAGITTVQHEYIRGTITSYNITLQRLFPHALSVQVGYVANRQNDLTRPQNLNYGQIGGGAASQPFNQLGLADNLRTTSTMNVFRPLGKVTYDSAQFSVSRRMTNGLQLTSAYTYARSIDWWADSIPIPEYWDLNKGPQGGATRVGASVPHKVDASVVYELPFGGGRKFLNNGGILGSVVGGWQLSSSFTAYSGSPFTVTSSATSLNAPGSTQRADQVKDTVEILGGVGPQSAYFDVTAFAPVTTARFGTAKVNSLRGPGVRNIDLSATRTLAATKSAHLQLKVEIFNLLNTATFANPTNLNVSNLLLNPDGTVRDLNGFGVINTTNFAGREYSERYIRLGMRLSF
jgi:Carboxypeptidase regulatory-like domain/TonB dependent receptor